VPTNRLLTSKVNVTTVGLTGPRHRGPAGRERRLGRPGPGWPGMSR